MIPTDTSYIFLLLLIPKKQVQKIAFVVRKNDFQTCQKGFILPNLPYLFENVVKKGQFSAE